MSRHDPGRPHPSQLLGHERLWRVEAFLKLSHRLLAGLEQLHDPQAHWVAEHAHHLRSFGQDLWVELYLSQGSSHMNIVI